MFPHIKINCAACRIRCNFAKSNRSLLDFNNHIDILYYHFIDKQNGIVKPIAETFVFFENIEGVRGPRYSSARRVYKRHRSSGYSNGDITFDQFIQISQMNCYYCDVAPSSIFNTFISDGKIARKQSIENGDFIYNGLDRISSKIASHNLDNCVPCCRHCNRSKSDMTIDEFKEWIIRVHYNNHFI